MEYRQTDFKVLRERYLSGLTIPVDDDPDMDRFDEENINLLLYRVHRGMSVTKTNSIPSGEAHIHTFAHSIKLITVLHYLGADVNEVDQAQETPLMHAISSIHKNVRAVRFLLEHGADVHRMSESGHTAIGHAMFSFDPSIEIIQVLLRFGAIPRIEEEYSSLTSPLVWNQVRTTLCLVVMCMPNQLARFKRPVGQWIPNDILRCLKRVLV